jgi:hypothetical protein
MLKPVAIFIVHNSPSFYKEITTIISICRWDTCVNRKNNGNILYAKVHDVVWFISNKLCFCSIPKPWWRDKKTHSTLDVNNIKITNHGRFFLPHVYIPLNSIFPLT